ncbi:MAG: isocitrate/isopropylmalate dehydrogenase family protein [Candidatus Verstraetearchaeota archaeon]|nr:isocitrate/isopropylmalate dehydrogenase family protein [Candidatus Verstraetearchaeota archaeon]
MSFKIALIYGDGVGPEVIKAALEVLEALDFDAEYVEVKAGYEYWRRTGKPMEDGALDVIRSCRCVLKGPLMTPPGTDSYRSVTVMLRQTLDLYANVRPFKSFGKASKKIDMVIVRENTEDLYSGIEYRLGSTAITLRVVSERASKRIARFAFELAKREGRRKVAVVHKANVMKESCGLFRSAFFEVAKLYPEIQAEEIVVDSAAYRIVVAPETLDVLVTPNMFGDILSDVAAGVVGSLGLAPSANIGDGYAMFEPVHGTAPDIAGKGVANPIASILSAAMMLSYLGDAKRARAIEVAVDELIAEGRVLTPDMGGTAKTVDVAREVARRAREALTSFR